MRWTPRGRSSDLEDRRGSGGARGGLSLGRAGGLGLGGILLLFALSLATGQDFLSMLDPGGAPSMGPPSPAASSPAEEKMVEFVSFVLDDNQQTWERVLGGRYQRAKLVLFRDSVNSACGFAEAAAGPFYCPGDQKVYIDLGFYEELRRRFKAPGDFAQAYVIAHEVGHHVQTLLGVADKVQQFKEANPRQANPIQVRMELQADCLAGVWAHLNNQIKNRLQPGDVEEGLNAAAQIGDDMIQKQTQGYVVPESFTHGSAAQRVKWFKLGFDTGDPTAHDPFKVDQP
mgnify:CR=1 FL=1